MQTYQEALAEQLAGQPKNTGISGIGRPGGLPVGPVAAPQGGAPGMQDDLAKRAAAMGASVWTGTDNGSTARQIAANRAAETNPWVNRAADMSKELAARDGQQAGGPGALGAAGAAPQGGMAAPDLSTFQQRGGGTGGMFKGAFGGASMGATVGSAVPGIGTAIGAGAGALGGALMGAFTKHAKTAPTDYAVEDARTAINQAYQHSLGRDASPQELDSQLAGQGLQQGDRYVGQSGLQSVLDSIGKSEEAQKFAATAAAAPQGGLAGPAAPATAGPSAPGGLGAFANRLEGFDSGKLNSGHNSPKYAIARALSNFDPRQGVTPEALAALNKLGIGTFSGSGDKVSIANGDPRFEGVNSLDLVRGFNDPNGTGGWQYGVEDGGAPAATAGPAKSAGLPGGAPAGAATDGGNIAGIQQQLAALQSQPDMLKQLIAALSGGK